MCIRDRFETLHIGEIGQSQRSNSHICAGGAFGGDIALTVQRDIGHWQLTRIKLKIAASALQSLIQVVDDIAFVVNMKTAGAGIVGARGVLDLEKTAAIDGKVQCVISGVNIALLELLVDRLGMHTQADAAATATAAYQIAKFRTGMFETSGVDIGNVISSRIQIGSGRINACLLYTSRCV